MESILFGHWIEVFLYIRCIGYIQHFWSGHFELYIRSRSWADFDVSQTDYTLLSRIQQKIWKLANGNIYDLLYDRSAERLVLEPQYLLYGAGEGFFERFIPYDGFEQLLSPGVFDVFPLKFIWMRPFLHRSHDCPISWEIIALFSPCPRIKLLHAYSYPINWGFSIL